MGAFPVQNVMSLGTRKKALAQKLMGRALGGRAGGGGSLFRQPGTMARGGGASRMMGGDSTNPWAVGAMGGAFGRGYEQEYGGAMGSQGQAVGEGQLFGTPGEEQSQAVAGMPHFGETGGAIFRPYNPGAYDPGNGNTPLGDRSVGSGVADRTPIGDRLAGSGVADRTFSGGSGPIHLGDGMFFDPTTGQIVSGSGDYSGYGSGGGGLGTSRY